MKRFILLAVFLISISSILFACQSKENNTEISAANPSTNLGNEKKLSINTDFKSISISKSKGTNEITFDDKETLEAFQEIFSSAVKEPGIVDMADPEFYMDAVYEKDQQQSLYLWIGEKGQRSTFMKTEDTHTIYTVSTDTTDKLIELVETHFY
ncbi:hypothetical protein ABXS71_20350 [Bacillus infantis]|uniref:hypothetical protein n=1 Tax=Bacillus infantis TaxID=324767 RepID=UPI00344DC789